jgi:tetratricopeptide (TPR) repeat protein
VADSAENELGSTEEEDVRTPPILLLLLVAAVLSGCSVEPEAEKIPITTTSEHALAYYLEGRDLAEKLRNTESRAFFQKAIEEDPNFAIAHLNVAFTQPTARDFFASFDRAKLLAKSVSEGEQLWILGFEAGVLNGDPMSQRQMFRKLVELYPKDERAHNLLAGSFFGQQEWEQAISEYQKALDINPEFSQPYNQMGYAYRFLERYDEAEGAFEKYVELIPDDPNPYDSYAELLMKTGRFGESIEKYRRALEIDSGFVFSHLGIASNLNYLGEYEMARQQLETMYAAAVDDGQRRNALTAMAVSYVDEGKLDKALEKLREQLALAEAIKDVGNMSADWAQIGLLQLETGEYEEAKAAFEKAVDNVESSTLSGQVKHQTKLGYEYNIGRALAAAGEIEAASKHADYYMTTVTEVQNAFQIKLGNELMGVIALQDAKYDKAIAFLQKANQQNPYNLYRIAVAAEGKGETGMAKEYYARAADFNINNAMAYSLIRLKAKEKAASL